MPLASGTSVGPYEVVAIGAGRNERLRLCRAEDCESEARHQREFAAGVGPRLGRPVLDLDTPSAAARRRPRAGVGPREHKIMLTPRPFRNSRWR